MPDINYTRKLVVRRKSDATLGAGDSGNLKLVGATISLPTTAAASTIKLARIPSNARISGLSRIYWDDLAASGSPTLSVGLASVKDNFTSVNNALTSGLDVATAAGNAPLLNDHANYGKMAWELAGLSQDPGGEMDVYATVVSATTNQTGDLSVEVAYTLD